MGNVTEEKWIEMLEKKADGNYVAKYPKVKSKSGVTFDEHLADYVQFKGSSWTKIESITIPTSALEIEFDALEEYKELRLMVQTHKGDPDPGAAHIHMTFNNDTGANYAYSYINIGSTVNGSSSSSSERILLFDAIPRRDISPWVFANIYIYNVNNKPKHVQSLHAKGLAPGVITLGRWNVETESINKITLTASTSSFVENSTFELWGVK